jgi:4-oxalocrotonate tautomerase
MPVIQVNLFEGRTREQKAEVARRFTDTVCEVLKVEPASVRVLFRDYSRADWAVGGTLMDEKGG